MRRRLCVRQRLAIGAVPMLTNSGWGAAGLSIAIGVLLIAVRKYR